MDNDEEFKIDLYNFPTMSTVVPNNPTVGSIWIDTSTMSTSIYNSIDWTTIGGDSGTIDINNVIFDRPMFEDAMPDPQELKRMCKEYPGLEKVYENFKTIYKLVEQDWRGKQKERNNP
jgi:hypothetical protein